MCEDIAESGSEAHLKYCIYSFPADFENLKCCLLVTQFLHSRTSEHHDIVTPTNVDIGGVPASFSVDSRSVILLKETRIIKLPGCNVSDAIVV